MIKILPLLFLISLNLFGGSIRVAVAANVSYAIEALKDSFVKEYPNAHVEIILASSGKLTAQIKRGAPYDIFMSANMKYPDALYKEGLSITAPKIYAQGSLALLSLKKRDFSKGISIILDKNIKRIAVANPKTAPYGIATKEALQKAQLYKQVKSKFVYGESISQTLTYTLKAAEIGFVAKSALYGKKMQHFKEYSNWIELDSMLYTPISQGIILLKHAKENHDAKLFYEYILSAKAKAIFKKFGYTTL